jgi:hypothetical protein
MFEKATAKQITYMTRRWRTWTGCIRLPTIIKAGISGIHHKWFRAKTKNIIQKIIVRNVGLLSIVGMMLPHSMSIFMYDVPYMVRPNNKPTSWIPH